LLAQDRRAAEAVLQTIIRDSRRKMMNVVEADVSRKLSEIRGVKAASEQKSKNIMNIMCVFGMNCINEPSYLQEINTTLGVQFEC
jgi:hypothetical protein